MQRWSMLDGCRLALLVAVLGCGGCAEDAGDDAACETPGRASSCDCGSGSLGTRLCQRDRTFGDCHCDAVRTVPCDQPGAAFACYCGDAGVGVEYCLASGRYSACDCAGGGGEPGGVDAAMAGDGDGADAPVGCPVPFRCVEQMGVFVCADATGFPPFCNQSPSECAAAGLPDAPCIDTGMGFKVCGQTCE